MQQWRIKLYERKDYIRVASYESAKRNDVLMVCNKELLEIKTYLLRSTFKKKQILILIWAREEGKFTTPRWLSQVNSKTVKAVRLAFYKIQ